MSAKKENIKNLCVQAILKVDEAIQKHKDGIPADFDEQVLLEVRSELIKMRDVLDSKRYRPMYGRFLLDWPDEYGLREYLNNVAYQYERKV